MKYHQLLHFLLAFSLAYLSTAQAETKTKTVEIGTGWHETSLVHDGQTRYFRYFVPASLAVHPDVVMVFHGGTRSMRKIFRSRAGGQPLWFYEVRGGGHIMPLIKHDVVFIAQLLVGKQNKDLEATHEAWNFLKRFTRAENR